jgi:tetratricopeptide (TPR) repeat protein
MRGDVGGAIREYKKALELDPSDFACAGALGEAYSGLGDWGNAVAYLKKSIALNPSHPRARGDLCMALLRMGELDDAEKEAHAALELSPYYWMPNFVLAILCELGGKYAEAAEWFHRSAHSTTDTPGADQWPRFKERSIVCDATLWPATSRVE